MASKQNRRQTSRRLQLAWIGSGYARRLRVESLEDRRLLAAVTVGNNLDVVNGDTSSITALIAAPGDDGISLRESILAANQTAGADEISFVANLSGQTILLTGGQLAITQTLSIDATSLAQHVTIDAQQISRVMNFSASTGDLTLAGLTMRNGKTTVSNSGGGGGGVRFNSGGILTLNQCTLSENRTVGDFARGGGIFANNGDVTLNQSTLSGNSTAGRNAVGGGFYSNSGDVTLNQSTLSGNSTAGEIARGGGIHTTIGAVTLNQSTLSGNSTTGADSIGGGIYTNSGYLTLNQSTLSGNNTAGARSDGGGIFASFASITLNQSTFSGNSTAGADANGGGIFKSTLGRPLTIRNSIFAGNTVAAGNTGLDLATGPGAIVTVNYSLIGTAITPSAGGNNISTDAPLLGPLADNGGPTQTHALLPGSPALDAGTPTDGATHIYELNNSLADALGGPSLVSLGGALTATGYQFGPNRGLNLSSAIPAGQYSIELIFSWDTVDGTKKIIDFRDLTRDAGLYAQGSALQFFDTALTNNVSFSPHTPIRLVLTRDGQSRIVTAYVDGVEVLSFVDVNQRAWFMSSNQIARFFQDDTISGQSEAGSGSVDRIRIYDRALAPFEVMEPLADQRGAEFPRIVDGDGVSGARRDIGAYEAQVKPSADFDGNTFVDGADFLAWQRGVGAPNATRAQGNSDGDADADHSDLAAWRSQFGATGVSSFAAIVTAANQSISAAQHSATPKDAAFDAVYADDFASLLPERSTFRPLKKARFRVAAP